MSVFSCFSAGPPSLPRRPSGPPPPPPEGGSSDDAATADRVMVIALFDYDGTEEGYLSLKEGDVFEAVASELEAPAEGGTGEKPDWVTVEQVKASAAEKPEPRWVTGWLMGEKGLFPSNYVEVPDAAPEAVKDQEVPKSNEEVKMRTNVRRAYGWGTMSKHSPLRMWHDETLTISTNPSASFPQRPWTITCERKNSVVLRIDVDRSTAIEKAGTVNVLGTFEEGRTTANLRFHDTFTRDQFFDTVTVLRGNCELQHDELKAEILLRRCLTRVKTLYDISVKIPSAEVFPSDDILDVELLLDQTKTRRAEHVRSTLNLNATDLENLMQSAPFRWTRLTTSATFLRFRELEPHIEELRKIKLRLWCQELDELELSALDWISEAKKVRDIRAQRSREKLSRVELEIALSSGGIDRLNTAIGYLYKQYTDTCDEPLAIKLQWDDGLKCLQNDHMRTCPPKTESGSPRRSKSPTVLPSLH